MARILFAMVLLVADVKYGSSTVQITYAGLYSDFPSSSSGVFERNRRLTNTKVRKLINRCDILDLKGKLNYNSVVFFLSLNSTDESIPLTIKKVKILLEVNKKNKIQTVWNNSVKFS